MLPARLRPAARRFAPRLAGVAFSILTLGLVACGVPISAVEMTATAENGGGVDPNQPALLTVATSTSSRSSGLQAVTAQGTAVLTVTPQPTATADAAVTGTPSPTGTPGTVTPTPDVAALALTGTPSATPTPSGTSTPGPTATPNLNDSQQAVTVLNQQRAAQGLTAVRIDPNLLAAANAYARAMAEGNFFSHTGLDGSTPQSRTTASGYRGSFKGEALSAGQATPAEAIDAWATSPAHAAIIYNATAVDVGIGVYFGPGSTYGKYWVFISGAP